MQSAGQPPPCCLSACPSSKEKNNSCQFPPYQYCVQCVYVWLPIRGILLILPLPVLFFFISQALTLKSKQLKWMERKWNYKSGKRCHWGVSLFCDVLKSITTYFFKMYDSLWIQRFKKIYFYESCTCITVCFWLEMLRFIGAGTQQDRRGSRPSLLPTTGEPWWGLHTCRSCGLDNLLHVFTLCSFCMLWLNT